LRSASSSGLPIRKDPGGIHAKSMPASVLRGRTVRLVLEMPRQAHQLGAGVGMILQPVGEDEPQRRVVRMGNDVVQKRLLLDAGGRHGAPSFALWFVLRF